MTLILLKLLIFVKYTFSILIRIYINNILISVLMYLSTVTSFGSDMCTYPVADICGNLSNSLHNRIIHVYKCWRGFLLSLRSLNHKLTWQFVIKWMTKSLKSCRHSVIYVKVDIILVQNGQSLMLIVKYGHGEMWICVKCSEN